MYLFLRNETGQQIILPDGKILAVGKHIGAYNRENINTLLIGEVQYRDPIGVLPERGAIRFEGPNGGRLIIVDIDEPNKLSYVIFSIQG